MSVDVTKIYPVNLGSVNGFRFKVDADNSGKEVVFLPGRLLKGCIAVGGTDTLAAANGVLNSNDGTEGTLAGSVYFNTELDDKDYEFIVIY